MKTINVELTEREVKAIDYLIGLWTDGIIDADLDFFRGTHISKKMSEALETLNSQTATL